MIVLWLSRITDSVPSPDAGDGAGLAVGDGDLFGVEGAGPVAVAAQHDPFPDPVAAMPVVPVEVGGELTAGRRGVGGRRR